MIHYRVKSADLHYWYWEDSPFILVIFDAQAERVYWVHLRTYVDDHPRLLQSDQATVTVRIPMTNKVTLRAIDQWREMSLKSAR